MLASKDGRIVCENTLDARLSVVFKQNLPEVNISACEIYVVFLSFLCCTNCLWASCRIFKIVL